MAIPHLSLNLRSTLVPNSKQCRKIFEYRVDRPSLLVDFAVGSFLMARGYIVVRPYGMYNLSFNFVTLSSSGFDAE